MHQVALHLGLFLDIDDFILDDARRNLNVNDRSLLLPEYRLAYRTFIRDLVLERIGFGGANDRILHLVPELQVLQ